MNSLSDAERLEPSVSMNLNPIDECFVGLSSLEEKAAKTRELLARPREERCDFPSDEPTFGKRRLHRSAWEEVDFLDIVESNGEYRVFCFHCSLYKYYRNCSERNNWINPGVVVNEGWLRNFKGKNGRRNAHERSEFHQKAATWIDSIRSEKGGHQNDEVDDPSESIDGDANLKDKSAGEATEKVEVTPDESTSASLNDAAMTVDIDKETIGNVDKEDAHKPRGEDNDSPGEKIAIPVNLASTSPPGTREVDGSEKKSSCQESSSTVNAPVDQNGTSPDLSDKEVAVSDKPATSEVSPSVRDSEKKPAATAPNALKLTPIVNNRTASMSSRAPKLKGQRQLPMAQKLKGQKQLPLGATRRPQATIQANGKPEIWVRSGRGNYDSPGAKVMREIVSHFVKPYMEAASTRIKTLIVNNIVAEIEHHGLVFINDNYEKMTAPRSREKVAHTLRDMVRKAKEVPESTQADAVAPAPVAAAAAAIPPSLAPPPPPLGRNLGILSAVSSQLLLNIGSNSNASPTEKKAASAPITNPTLAAFRGLTSQELKIQKSRQLLLAPREQRCCFPAVEPAVGSRKFGRERWENVKYIDVIQRGDEIRVFCTLCSLYSVIHNAKDDGWINPGIRMSEKWIKNFWRIIEIHEEKTIHKRATEWANHICPGHLMYRKPIGELNPLNSLKLPTKSANESHFSLDTQINRDIWAGITTPIAPKPASTLMPNIALVAAQGPFGRNVPFNDIGKQNASNLLKLCNVGVDNLVGNTAAKRVVSVDEPPLKRRAINFVDACLEPSDQSARLKEYSDMFLEGTRTWAFRAIDEWLTKKDRQRIFVFVAEAGMGKTSLSSKIITERKAQVVAYHFCRHEMPDKSHPKLILFSLASQLSNHSREYSTYLGQCLTKLSSRSDPAETRHKLLHSIDLLSLFELLFLNPLSSCKDMMEKKIMVIDGLDEIVRDQKSGMLECIQRHFVKLPQWLKVFITTRPESPTVEVFKNNTILGKLKVLKPYFLSADDVKNKADLHTYFSAKVRCLYSQRRNIEEATEILSGFSKGLFIHAHYTAELLHTMKEVTLDSLKNLQTDIDDFYELQLRERVFSGQSGLLDHTKSLEWRAICSITMSYEAIHVRTLEKLLGCTSLERKECVNKLSIFFPKVDQRLQVLHESVTKWLTDSRRCDEDFYISPRRSHKQMAERCYQLLEDSLPNQDKTRDDEEERGSLIFLLKHTARHFIEGGELEPVRRLLLFDKSYIEARVEVAKDVEGLLRDCTEVGKVDRVVFIVGMAIRLSSGPMAQISIAQLSSQLIDRLQNLAHEEDGETHSSLRKVIEVWKNQS